jgi:hypothetical protein
MRDYKKLLTSFIEIVTFLLAAFGGFLKQIAPPEETGSTYAVGLLSFLVLIALLIISALARGTPGAKFRRNWILAGTAAFLVAIPPSFLYPSAREQYTWSYPPGSAVQRVQGGDVGFTPELKAFLKDHPHESSSPQELARKFDLDEIWTAESLRQARTRLLALYAWLVLSLATAVFCLLEANVAVGGEEPTSAPPARETPVTQLGEASAIGGVMDSDERSRT